jgi:hypothetical protein
VQKRGPNRPVPEVELLIQLCIVQVLATKEQLARRPSIMPQQAVQQIHRPFLTRVG